MQTVIHPMRLSAIFPAEAILIGLEHRTKPSVVAELVHRLVELCRIPARDEQALIEAVMTRERTATTALWNGMAMPNVRTSLTDGFVGVLAVEPEGVDFEAVGGGLVKVVFLLLAPLESRADCFEALGKIAAVGKNRSVLLQLAGCRSAREVQQVLHDLDQA
jgi:mannitol/fructose-specific phosphotransferase system IIA component (Ntr-type)